MLTTAQLRAHGVPAAEVNEQCRPDGPWQQLLPGVVLLHSGPPTGEERLHAVLTYAARERTAGVPVQPGAEGPHRPTYTETMVTGLAALALHGFTSAPELASLKQIDVLVPRMRRLRSTGCARIVRTASLPTPQQVKGVPVAPVPRALADAVAELSDANAVRGLLTEAVRGGHCEPAAVVRELNNAKLLKPAARGGRGGLAAGRGPRDRGGPPLPDGERARPPRPGVERRPAPAGRPAPGRPGRVLARAGGGRRAGHPGPRQDEDALWSEYARKREHLERLGITVVHITPKKLRDAMEQQAAVVRTALMASADRDPAAYVVVLPR